MNFAASAPEAQPAGERNVHTACVHSWATAAFCGPLSPPSCPVRPPSDLEQWPGCATMRTKGSWQPLCSFF